jgi:hypothetical protein
MDYEIKKSFRFYGVEVNFQVDKDIVEEEQYHPEYQIELFNPKKKPQTIKIIVDLKSSKTPAIFDETPKIVLQPKETRIIEGSSHFRPISYNPKDKFRIRMEGKPGWIYHLLMTPMYLIFGLLYIYVAIVGSLQGSKRRADAFMGLGFLASIFEKKKTKKYIFYRMPMSKHTNKKIIRSQKYFSKLKLSKVIELGSVVFIMSMLMFSTFLAIQDSNYVLVYENSFVLASGSSIRIKPQGAVHPLQGEKAYLIIAAEYNTSVEIIYLEYQNAASDKFYVRGTITVELPYGISLLILTSGTEYWFEIKNISIVIYKIKNNLVYLVPLVLVPIWVIVSLIQIKLSKNKLYL